MELKNCPDEFYKNCRNQIRLCYCCVAGAQKYGKKVIHYDPIDESLTPHPHEEVLKTQQRRGRVANKQGRQAEKHSRKAMADKLVKETIASGSVKGDADASLLNLAQMEHKLRDNIGITPAEYSKGVKQGVGVWQLTTKAGDRRMYILTEDVYLKLTSQFYKDSAQL